MSEAAQRALSAETEFLAGVSSNLMHAANLLLRGHWFEKSERDAAEGARAALIERGIFDRDMLKRLPTGRTIRWTGYERRLLFGRREVSVTIASVLAPPGPLLDGKPAPTTLAELAAHVRQLTAGVKSPAVVAVCSPAGFSDDVWTGRLDPPGVKVIVVAPHASHDGWRSRAISSGVDERLVRCFDPEGVAEKLRRIQRELEERGGDLLVGGVSAQAIAQRLDLSPRLVEGALELMCREHPELRLTRHEGEVVLYRGAPVNHEREGRSMLVPDWLRSLFQKKGDEVRKINELSARRAALSQRRDRLYEDIGRLEVKEQQLSNEGKQTTSSIVRRRLAAQISQIRKDISRVNTTAAMLNQQINVISTHIHNLTLIQQGQMAQLPTAEELTEDAVRAEEMLEQLRADTEMIHGLETGVAETMVTDDEAAILKEFEAADAARAPAQPAAASPAAVPAQPASPAAARPAPLSAAQPPEKSADRMKATES